MYIVLSTLLKSLPYLLTYIFGSELAIFILAQGQEGVEAQSLFSAQDNFSLLTRSLYFHVSVQLMCIT